MLQPSAAFRCPHSGELRLTAWVVPSSPPASATPYVTSLSKAADQSEFCTAVRRGHQVQENRVTPLRLQKGKGNSLRGFPRLKHLLVHPEISPYFLVPMRPRVLKPIVCQGHPSPLGGFCLCCENIPGGPATKILFPWSRECWQQGFHQADLPSAVADRSCPGGQELSKLLPPTSSHSAEQPRHLLVLFLQNCEEVECGRLGGFL